MKKYFILTLFALALSTVSFGQTTTDTATESDKIKTEQTVEAENAKTDSETQKLAKTTKSKKKGSSCCKKSSASSCKGKGEAKAKACCDKATAGKDGKACCDKMADKMKEEKKKEATKKS